MNIYDFEVVTIECEKIRLKQYEGKVLLIVNTATKCGFTPQYEGLQTLYETYHDRGFEILDFPCNQFGGQAPGSEAEIQSFCNLNYRVGFPQFAKIKVNGKNEHPLYTYLKSQQSGLLGSAIKWNFTKFLINKKGEVVDRFAPTDSPQSIAKKIENLL